MRSYESVVIIDSQLEDEPIEKEIAKIENLITTQKGELVGLEKWGRRKLSYSMKGRQQGYYALIRFNAEAKTPLELDRTLNLNERVLRHMTTEVRKHEPIGTESLLDIDGEEVPVAAVAAE